MLMRARNITGGTVYFVAYNETLQAWDGAAFASTGAAIAASSGSHGWVYATAPTGTRTYELRGQAGGSADLDNDAVLFFGNTDRDVIQEDIDGIATAVSGSGTGARSVTITVNDGSSALENARVRFSEGVNTYFATTNASGVATFSLDDATYTLTITKAGYSFTPTTQVVDGTETITKSMTQVSVSPASDPDQANAYLTTYDEQGNAESGITISFKLLTPPGEAGQSFSGDRFTGTSSGTSAPNLTIPLLRNSTYEAWRGTDEGRGRKKQFTVDDAATYALPEILGYDT